LDTGTTTRRERATSDEERGGEVSKPRPYQLDDPAEIARLIRETLGYMRVSRMDGTDRKGRQHAIDALEWLVAVPGILTGKANP
jgi:hypothetical protein